MPTKFVMQVGGDDGDDDDDGDDGDDGEHPYIPISHNLSIHLNG